MKRVFDLVATVAVVISLSFMPIGVYNWFSIFKVNGFFEIRFIAQVLGVVILFWGLRRFLFHDYSKK